MSGPYILRNSENPLTAARQVTPGIQSIVNWHTVGLLHENSTMQELRALIEGCKRMDPKSQHRFYDLYYGLCLRTAYRYLDDYDEAVEGVHHAYVKIFRGLPGFDPSHKGDLERALTKWIKCKVIEEVVCRLWSVMVGEGCESHSEPIEGPGVEGHPVEDSGRLIDALRELPMRLRTAYNLRVIDGYPLDRIAQCLGTTAKAVEEAVRVARVLLGKTVPTSAWSSRA